MKNSPCRMAVVVMDGQNIPIGIVLRNRRLAGYESDYALFMVYSDKEINEINRLYNEALILMHTHRILSGRNN